MSPIDPPCIARRTGGGAALSFPPAPPAELNSIAVPTEFLDAAPGLPGPGVRRSRITFFHFHNRMNHDGACPAGIRSRSKIYRPRVGLALAYRRVWRSES
jgi:hypothetical protein